ncbi:MAG: response regulator transcription factor [Sphingobacteriales bacterium]|nr:MAG: response regulator transcription factor [Sphingobacteriales bacterium]
MNAIIIDDEPSNIENLNALLKKHCPKINVTGIATDIHSGADLVKQLQPELLFLDIQMGAHQGFDLLELLPEKNFEVIFVTAYDQYGIKAVKFAALDYLLKPVDIDELITAVNKAENKLNNKKNNVQLDFLLQHLQKPEQSDPKIALPQQQEIRYLKISEIVRCRADNSYTYFYLLDGEMILISKALKEYADLLQPHGFIRSHQSHLVNPRYVKSWLKEDGGTLLLNNGEKIPVSKPNREKVKYSLSV